MSAAPAGITVRRLGLEDAGAYRDIRLAGLQSDPSAFASTYAAESGQAAEFFAERLRQSAVFGAAGGAGLVGIAGFRIKEGEKQAHKGSLLGMYVRPEARRAGIGRCLVEAVVAHARDQVELVQLSVVADHVAALRLYAGLGFVEYGFEKDALKHDGRYYDEVLMALSLRRERLAG